MIDRFLRALPDSPIKVKSNRTDTRLASIRTGMVVCLCKFGRQRPEIDSLSDLDLAIGL
jgi:hypothetical protein